MRTKAILVALSAAMPVAAYAEAIPAPLQYDNRVRTIDYNPSDIVHIQGAYGMVTKVTFGPSEVVEHVAAGDTLAWEVAYVRNHLFLKPREPNAYTNLSVLTNLRTYDLELNVTDKKSTNVFLQVVYAYPIEDAKAAAAEAKKEQEIRRIAVLQLNQKQQERHRKDQLDTAMRSAETPERAHINYWVRGSEEVAPDEAWDDGVFTYFRFRGNREMPVVYLQDDDDEESLINTTVKGDTVIVQRLAHRYILRKHKDVAQVVNPNYDPVGKASITGTITPKVKRAIKDGEDPHPAVLPSLPAEAREPAPTLPERVDIEDVQSPDDLPPPAPPAFLSLLTQTPAGAPVRLQGEAPKPLAPEPAVVSMEVAEPPVPVASKKKERAAEPPVAVETAAVETEKFSAPKLTEAVGEPAPAPMLKPEPIAGKSEEPEIFIDEMATNKSAAELVAIASNEDTSAANEVEPITAPASASAPSAAVEVSTEPDATDVTQSNAVPSPGTEALNEGAPDEDTAEPITATAGDENDSAAPEPTFEATPVRPKPNAHLYTAIDSAMAVDDASPAPFAETQAAPAVPDALEKRTEVAKPVQRVERPRAPSMAADVPKAVLEDEPKVAKKKAPAPAAPRVDAAAALIAEAEAGLLASQPAPADKNTLVASPEASDAKVASFPAAAAVKIAPERAVFRPRIIPEDAPRPPRPPDAKVYTGPIDQETWINLYIFESAPTYTGPSFRTGKIARVVQGTWRRAIGRDATGEWFAIVDVPYTSWVHASAVILDGNFDRLPLHPLGGNVSSTLATN